LASLDPPSAWYVDDARHVIFCVSAGAQKKCLEEQIRKKLTVVDLISDRVESEKKWNAISNFLGQFMRQKEKEERLKEYEERARRRGRHPDDDKHG